MQASYAVIRYLPSILREEFINVGVLLVCPEAAYQGIRALPSFSKERGRLSAFENADGHFVQHALTKLNHAVESSTFHELVGRRAAPDGALTLSGLEELRRSYHNNIRLTEPRTALTVDPQATLEELFNLFVAESAEESARHKVTREKMRAKVVQTFSNLGLFDKYADRVQKKVKPVAGATRVDIFYKNGVSHFYQVIPFVNPERTASVANSYRMLAADIRKPARRREFENAKFSVFGYEDPSDEHMGEIGEIKALLEQDDIELLDYRDDAVRVAQQISRELDSRAEIPLSQAP